MKKFQLLLILLLFSSGALMAQTRVLTGTVRDSATNAPMPDVTVKVKSQNIAATTGADGAFSINIPSTSTVLQISYVGYATQEIPVDPDQTNLIISLGRSSGVLSEVVVTALGISKDARKVGYAVTKVDGSQLSQARETNVAYSLEGRVAGLNITPNAGGPGASAKILLRGMSSFTAGGPLFVINGVPMDNSQRGNAGEWGGSDQGDGISNINPDDIESMTVLKGSSASALYGTRASNGVILITTKSAKKGTMTVELNSNNVLDKPIDATDFQYEYGQGQHGVRPANATDALNTTRLSWGEKLDGQSTIQFDGNSYPYSAQTNNIKDFYRNAFSSTNTVAVGSGNENGNFRLSLSNLDALSIVRNSNLIRRTVNLNLNHTIWNKLNVSLTANYIDEASHNRAYLSDGPLNPNNLQFLATNINQSILAPGWDPTSPVGAEKLWTDDIYVTNPYFVVNRGINDVARKRLIAAMSARYNFTDWIYLQGRLGWDVLNDRYFQVNPTGLAYSQDLKGGFGNLSTNQTIELNPDVLAGIRHDITKDISFDLTLGAALRKRQFENFGLGGGPFVIPFLYSPYNVVSFSRSYAFTKYVSHSAYYSLDLSYKNLLTLTTTGRYDTYSTLPSTNRDIFTPSVVGSFIFSELIKSDFLTYGKLRAAYSQTSAEPGQPYITQQYFSVGNTINGVSTGNFSNTLPNLYLKPYTLNEVEVGTELKFLRNRLGLDVTYFHRQTKNEILNGNLSQATGYNSYYIGTGSTENQGIEALVNYSVIQSKNFIWNTSFNFTYVKNKILDIYGSNSTNTQLGFGTYRPLNANLALVKGLPGPQIMAYDWSYNNQGQMIIDSASGLPIRAANLTPMGSTLPKFYGGWNNEFTYKGINLAFLVDYKFGNKVLSATEYYAIYRGLEKMTLEGRENGVTVSGAYASGKEVTTTVDAQDYYQRLASVSKYEVLDGSFIKLRQITLGYTFTDNMFGKLPFQSITVSLVARNLATLLKHTDNIDPESGFSTDIRYAGIEGTSLPFTRTYGINVNIKLKK